MNVLAALVVTTAAQGQIVINEVMADNRGAVENGPDFPDYIELHNMFASPMVVSGMSVTDDPFLPQKYVIPAGISIPAQGYLILWCDVNFASPGLHTGFGLGANTDRVQLYASDGFSRLDDIPFGISVPDLSIGRVPNGIGSWTLTQPTPLASNAAQPLGSITQLRLNEWMASPPAGTEDWIEVYNADILPVALDGLVITDTAAGLPANRAIPAFSFVGGRNYVQFFASDLEEPDADHLDIRLGAGGETLTIYAANRTTILDRVTFGAQTANTSQGRAPDGSDNIVFFPTGAATPEAPNQILITDVIISEVLAHTDPPLEDAIELQNVTDSSVDISHWWLSDSAGNTKKFRIPAGTVLAPFGFKVFYQNQFDTGMNAFSLNSAEGDEIVLSSGNASGQLTGAQTIVAFGATRNGVSFGRYQTSVGSDFVALNSRTFGMDNPVTLNQFRSGTGLSNASPRIGPIVITEIYFAPLLAPETGGEDDEFVELHNPTGAPVKLYDEDFPTNSWRLRDGITFNLPLNLTIPAGGFIVVVSFDPALDPAKLASFRTRFNVPEAVPVIGPYTGRLSNSGETFRLQVPDHPEGPGPSQGLVPYELIEAIRYAPATPWPTGADGTGLSLHRTSATAYGNEPLNWSTAAPTPGRFAATPPPELRVTSIAVSGGNVHVKFTAGASSSYALQSRPQLVSGSWTSITNVTTVSAGEVSVSVPTAGPAQFYQVIRTAP
ncbi:MAG TPA: lamin tail domain-containing protein [Methylomirabilota bacterium]|nr:lamin tail domain-containing protein [Methylomirabilota bacterium]